MSNTSYNYGIYCLKCGNLFANKILLDIHDIECNNKVSYIVCCNRIFKITGLKTHRKSMKCTYNKQTYREVKTIIGKCLDDGCNTVPSFGYTEYGSALCCVKHKFDNMININGNEIIIRNYKIKEQSVVDYVLFEFPDNNWICDKTISNYSKRRPDMLLNLENQVIIIEIDENQHKCYNPEQENERIMEISQDLEYKPIIFIRFNPDSYIINNANSGGVVVTSCWSKSGDDMIINKSKYLEYNERLEQLKNTINYWLINHTEKIIEIVYLYYDR